jgi:hypothetical protein
MPISPSKSRDLANENNEILTEWKCSLYAAVSIMKGKRSAFTYIYFCYQTDSGVPNTNIYAAVSLNFRIFHFFFLSLFF